MKLYEICFNIFLPVGLHLKETVNVPREEKRKLAGYSAPLQVYLMATSDCSPVIFRKTFDNAFYFQVVTKADIGLESDAFQASELPSEKCWVQSKDNKTLLLLNKEHFEAQNLDSGELGQPDCHFKIKTFNQVPEESKVPAAMLYVTVDNENMVVCCGKEQKIYPEKKDIPQGIDGNKSKEIFYMTKLESSGCYEFESSEYRGYYLGFQPDASDPSFIQLVLHPKCGGEVVDACEVKIQSVQ